MAARYGSYRRKFPIIFISLLVVLGSVRSFEPPPKSQFEGKVLCSQRSGHSHIWIHDVKWRNSGCSIDCIMHQGLVLSYYVKDRSPCHRDGYQCLLGTCRSPDEYKRPRMELQEIEIKIISAYVPDKDRSPTQGESDVYVMVSIPKNGEPSYTRDDEICFTYVIQDNNRPKWKDFICKPLPIPTNALMRFTAYDSDKPFENPDNLGRAEEQLSYLLSNGRVKLPLVSWRPDGLESPYWVEVEVTGKKYEFPRKNSTGIFSDLSLD